MQADVKIKNSKKLKVKVLVDSRCTHMGINEQLVKKKRIQMKPMNFLFEVFNTDGMKNREVTKVVPLEIEINRHKQTLEAVVMDLNETDMFLGHDWLVKHNLEVNWKNSTIRFTRCLRSCTIKYEDIKFKTRRTKAKEIMETKETKEQDNGEIGKEPDRTNPEDLPEYIRPFIYLFNKKKLPERYEWDHEINLIEEVLKELNTKVYMMTLKEEGALN